MEIVNFNYSTKNIPIPKYFNVYKGDIVRWKINALLSFIY